MEQLGTLGHEVTVLSRSATRLPKGAAHIYAYDPLAAGEWFRHVDGQDAVVSLAGERAVGVRYTEVNKTRIRDSRVRGTEHLVQAIAQAKVKPQVFLSASAVGYYGSELGEEPCTESSAPGNDFLASVCVEWEARAKAAEACGVRVGLMRFGVILGTGGGALPALMRPFQMFVGGEVGSGEQYFSWIHIADVVGTIEHLLFATDAFGAFNVTAPAPVKNRELTRELGRVLDRPTLLKAPGFALKLVLGEGAAPLLGGRPVLPTRLSERGFKWKYPDLAAALGNLLG